jgi:DNA-directed RNA polymerase specialized sigma24 family protein
MAKRQVSMKKIRHENFLKELASLGDWDGVIAELDRWDYNANQREEAHGFLCANVIEVVENSMNPEFKKKVRRLMSPRRSQDDIFLEKIFNSPQDLHEMVSNESLIEPIRNLTALQKEMLYYRIVKGDTTKKLAAEHNMTDRNVRKHIQRAIAAITKKAKPSIIQSLREGKEITTSERKLVKPRPKAVWFASSVGNGYNIRRVA